jgi:hypothetical protein
VGLRLASGSCSESHGNSGLGQQGGAARGSGGFQACRKRPSGRFLHGVTRCFPRNSIAFFGFPCFGEESSSEHTANLARN